MIDYSIGKDETFITHYEVKDGNIVLYGKEKRHMPYTRDNEKLVLEKMKEQVKSWKPKVEEYRRDYMFTKKLAKFKFCFFVTGSGILVWIFRDEALASLVVGCVACITIFPIWHHVTKDIKECIVDYDKNSFFVQNEEGISKEIGRFISDNNLENASVSCLTINDLDDFTQEDLENIFNGNISDELSLRLLNRIK